MIEERTKEIQPLKKLTISRIRLLHNHNKLQQAK